MANDIEVHIFILVLISVVVFGGTVGRFWILRHRPRTPAVNFSDTAAILFACTMVIAVGLGFDGVNSELRIERTYGIENLNKRLLTTKYLKVSRRRNLWSHIGLKYVTFRHSVSNLLFSPAQEFFVVSIVCTTQVWLLKAAFLGYYWSLRETLSDKVKLLLYAVSAYAALTYIGVISLQLGYCRPLPRNWYVFFPPFDGITYIYMHDHSTNEETQVDRI